MGCVGGRERVGWIGKLKRRGRKSICLIFLVGYKDRAPFVGKLSGGVQRGPVGLVKGE